MLKLSCIRHERILYTIDCHRSAVFEIRAERTDFLFSQWRKPLFSNVLSLCISQIGRSEICTGGRVNKNGVKKCQQLGEVVRNRWYQRSINPFWLRMQFYHGLFRRGSSSQGCRIGQRKRPFSQGNMAILLWQRGERFDILTFFICIGAGYRRITKHPKGVPSLQLYAYQTEQLQELKRLYAKRKVNLFYGDESHVCTEVYVLYGWQLPRKDVFVLSERTKKLNIFGMIDRDSHFEGFCTSGSIDLGRVVDTHPYSLHLNIVETLWRIMKGKRIRLQYCTSANTFFYATGRLLTEVGKGLETNYTDTVA